MKLKFISQTVFLGKSLLWSLILYAIVMAAVNWEDLAHRKKQDNRNYVKKVDEKELIPIKVSCANENERIATSLVYILKDGIGYIKTIANIIF